MQRQDATAFFQVLPRKPPGAEASFHYLFPIARPVSYDYNGLMGMYPAWDNPDAFLERLRSGFQRPLPGRQAQQAMAPEHRPFDPESGSIPRRAAVLLPLYPDAGSIHIVLMKRKQNHLHHAGEISFPGGAAEDQDVDATHTALREFYEEMGILPDEVRILGLLTPLYIAPSHNMVQPVVGWLSRTPIVRPQPTEVEEIIQVRLNHFMRAATVRWRTLQLDGQTLRFPCYMLGKEYVWGATAMILSEFLTLLRNSLQKTAE